MMPEALDALALGERCQAYGMLRLKVEVSADGGMQARGVLSAGLPVPSNDGEPLCEYGLTSACNFRNTKLAELTFHAVLRDGTRELRFERLLTW
jgi:hypothetical protein